MKNSKQIPQDALTVLRTMKGLSLEEQKGRIEKLSEDYSDLGSRIASSLGTMNSGKVIEHNIVGDMAQLTKATLLSIVLNDIGSVQSREKRDQLMNNLEKVCEDLDIELSDVIFLTEFSAKLELLLLQDPDNL